MPPKPKEVKVCDVSGCQDAAERAVAVKKAGEVLKLQQTGHGKAHLCKTHYRDFKKATKKERKLDRIGWS